MKKLLLAALALALLLGAGCANGKANIASSSAAESAQGTEPEQENPLTESGALNFVFSSGAGGWSTQLTLQPDGTFTGRTVPGDGVAAELLKAHGVSIYGESRIPELLAAPPEEE